MSKCVNPNSKDVQLLISKGMDPLEAEVRVSRIYESIEALSNEDTDLDAVLKVSNISEMESKIIYDSLSEEVKSKLAPAVSFFGIHRSVKDYFKHGSIRSLSQVMDSVKSDVDSESYNSFLDDINDQYYLSPETLIKKAGSATSLDFIKSFSTRLNIPVTILTESEFFEKFPTRNPSTNPGFFEKGEVFFVEGYVSPDTIFHEFSHPIIKAIRLQNPEVFDKLYQEFLNDMLLSKSILDQLTLENELTYGTPDFEEEALVRALESLNASEKKSSFLSEFLFQVRQFLRKLFGSNIDISKLKLNTKLKDVVDMINYGKEFVFDRVLVSEADVTLFKTAYKEFAEPLKQMSDAKVQKFMDQFYEIVDNQVTILKSDNGMYSLLGEGLVNDTSSGYLEQVKKTLNGLAFLNSRNINDPFSKESVLLVDSEVTELESKIRSFAKVISDIDVLTNVFQKKTDLLLSTLDPKSDQFFDSFLGMLNLVSQWDFNYKNWISEIPYTIKNEKGESIDNPLRLEMLSQQSKLLDLKSSLEKIQTGAVIDLLYDNYVSLNEPIVESLKKDLVYYEEKGLQGPYESTYKTLYGITISERAELRYLNSISDLTLDQLNRKNELITFSESGYDMSKESFTRIFSGQYLDSSKISGLLESYASNQDNVVSTFYMYLKDSFNEINGNINSKRTDILNGLQPLLKAAGFDNTLLGEGKFGERISQRSKSFKKEGSEIVVHEEYKFLSNFKDWEYDYEVLKNELSKAKDNYKFIRTTESEKLLEEAENALLDFEKNYMHREYVDEYYQVYEALRTPIGRKALKLQSQLFEQMNLINSELAVDPNDKSFKDSLVRVWTEYRMLSSEYDEYGDLKTGENLEISRVLKEYRNNSREFYNWVESPQVFEQSFNTFIEDLNATTDKESPLYNLRISEWLKLNTTISVSDDYYNKRSSLIERRKELTVALSGLNNSFLDLTDLYDELNSLIRTDRDEYNTVAGSQMTLDKQQRIVELHKIIAEARENFFDKNGFTKSENKEYRKLRLKISQGESLTPTENSFIENYQANITYAASEVGIGPEEMSEIFEIDSALMAMTETIPTDSYISEIHSRLSNDPELKKEYSEYAETVGGFVIDDGDIPSSNLFNDLIHYNKSMIDSWMEKSSKFKEWFLSNHYEETGILKFDLLTGQVSGEYVGYRKTAAWQTSRPLSIADYNSKTAASLEGLPESFINNGVIMLDGMPVVPNRQYYGREVKDEYRTKKILRDYIDEDGLLVLANYSNQGKWLPKNFTNKEGSAKDGKYIDASYMKMFNEERELFDALDYLKNKQLDMEEGLSKNTRLYLTFPAFRKGVVEQYDRNYFKRKVNRFNAFRKGAADDYEFGAYTGVESENPYTKFTHPIQGNYKLDLIDVSTNIVRSMMQRMSSIEEYKMMRKKSSFAFSAQNALKNAMINPEILSFSEQLKTLNKFSPVDYSKNQRFVQVNQIVDKYINGINLVSPTGNEIRDKAITKFVSMAQRRLAIMAFALNPIKSLRNYFGGKFQLWKKTLDQNGYSTKSLIATRSLAGKTIKNMIAQRYSKTNVPVDLQLMDILNAIPGRLQQEIGIRGSNTVVQDLARGSFQFFDRKYLNDSVPVHQIYALMYSNKIKVDGELKPLYDLIVSIDGKIQTVPGVPKEWTISYSDSGEVVLGSAIKNLINEHESLLMKNLGINDHRSEPEAYRHIIGKVVFTMMKFFPGMAMDRYQFQWNKSDLRSGKKRLARRRNLNQRRLEYGTYMSSVVLLQEIYERKGKFWMLRSYSPQALVGFYQIAAGIGLQFLLRALVLGTGFDENDDDENDYYFDPYKKGAFSRLKKTTPLPMLPFISDDKTTVGTMNAFDSENYFKLQWLNLLTAVEQEEQTFNPLNVTSTGVNMITLNNALSDGGGVKELLNLIKMYQNPEEKATEIKRASGPFVWQEEGSSKSLNIFLRTLGLNGSMVDPAKTVESRYNFMK